jgi:signal transduction histidine kinase
MEDDGIPGGSSDVFDVARDNEHYRFLADLSTALYSASLDASEILSVLASTLVPRIAPACVVELVAGPVSLVAHACVELDGCVSATIEERSQARVAVGPGFDVAVDELRRPVAELLSSLGFPHSRVGASLEIPLGRRDTTWGRLVLLGLAPAAAERVIALGDEIAQRASMALDNALLFRAEHSARLRAEERARRVSILANVTRELARAVTVAEIADIFVALAVDSVGAVNGTLYLLDENREYLELLRAVGYSDRVMEGWQRVPLGADTALTDAIACAEPVWIPTSSEFNRRYPRHRELHALTGNHAAAALPLMTDGRAIGAIGLSFATEQAFDDEDQAFVCGLVDQCATAIERARLYERATAANDAKDQFLAVLSHELRTPLAPVLPAIEAIEEEPLSDAGRMMAEIARRNIMIETRLIDDLLDVARVINGKLVLHREQVDIHSTIRSVLNICRGDITTKGQTALVRLDATRTLVYGDPARLQQALWNLVKNAIKFTAVGGEIGITTRNGSDDRITITVVDTGMGIDRTMLVRIFDPFMQGNESVHKLFGGMGLGLAISKAVIDLHGGELAARSDGRGSGSEFSIVLDLDGASSSGTSVTPEAGLSGALAGDLACRVLLVDDHEDTSFALKRMLERSGFRVTTAHSCEAARQLAALGEFDVLVSDIGLPDGTGYDLLADIMLIKSVPAIAISGFGTDHDMARSRAVGFRSHLTKPVQHNVLVETIRRVLA